MLLKVRTFPNLQRHRRAGIEFGTDWQIVDVDDATAAKIMADSDSLAAVEVTVAEAAAFRSATVRAANNLDEVAAENVTLRTRVSDLDARVAELESALLAIQAADRDEAPDGGEVFGEPGESGRRRGRKRE